MASTPPPPSPVEHLNARFAAQPRTRQRALLGAAALAALVAVTVAALAGLRDLAVLVGAPAGIVLYLCLTLWWTHLLAPARRERFDSPRWGLSQRRAAVLVGAGVFATVLLLAGPHLPVVVPGTAVVTVSLLLWRIYRATPQVVADGLDSADIGEERP